MTRVENRGETTRGKTTRGETSWGETSCDPVWDPHTKDKSKQVEKVQRRAARWVSCNYVRLACVSDMLETLGWRSLQQRRADTRLCLFSTRLFTAL